MPRKDLRTELPDRLIVVSDLHLGEGNAPVRGGVSGEHFFYDREFATWLDRLTARAARRGRRLELVLNGDAFDFLRVVRLPDTPRSVTRWRRLLCGARVHCTRDRLRRAARGRFTLRERTFGFGTDEPSCVWKVGVIAAAHPRVFHAFAGWCRAGHALVIVRGNHDPEWAWPGVRRALLALLERAGAGPLRSGQVRFRPRVHRRANVHIEHGHEVDWLTRAERDFGDGRPTRLRLSFGSLISKYLLNVLERRVPPHTAVAPSWRLAQALRQQPWRLLPAIVTNAIRAIPFIGLAGWKPWFARLLAWRPARVCIAMSTAVLATVPLAPLVSNDLRGHSSTGVMAASLLGLGLPIAAFMTRQVAAEINREGLIRSVRRYARRLETTWRHSNPPRRYVVLGHTHRPEVCEWTVPGCAVVYLNPGAWVPREDGPTARFVWLARRGGAYVRHRLFPLHAVGG
jgi:UDP-2,3-diacylglucosamine pyrophosphatase LpxH